MGITVETPGILTTIQDEGRFGYQQFGVSPAGPMDTRSFYLANILVGNDRGEGAMEITYSGPSLKFDQDIAIAITGGDLQPSINDEAVPMYRALQVLKGDVLSFSMMHGKGSRAYVAFAGGLKVPFVMGSKSTLIRNQLGGIEGRKLQKGDRIDFANPRAVLWQMDRRRINPEVFGHKEIELRVVPGPQDTDFSLEELRRFFWYGAEITDEFDRMGCRLKREVPLRHKGDGNIITDGIAFGSIQVPPNGQPIIMLADRQSTGGYSKIGTVISVDLPKLAQSVPGNRVRFVSVSIKLAQELYVRQLRQLRKLEDELKKEEEHHVPD